MKSKRNTENKKMNCPDRPRIERTISSTKAYFILKKGLIPVFCASHFPNGFISVLIKALHFARQFVKGDSPGAGKMVSSCCNFLHLFRRRVELVFYM